MCQRGCGVVTHDRTLLHFCFVYRIATSSTVGRFFLSFSPFSRCCCCCCCACASVVVTGVGQGRERGAKIPGLENKISGRRGEKRLKRFLCFPLPLPPLFLLLPLPRLPLPSSKSRRRKATRRITQNGCNRPDSTAFAFSLSPPFLPAPPQLSIDAHQFVADFSLTLCAYRFLFFFRSLLSRLLTR